MSKSLVWSELKRLYLNKLFIGIFGVIVCSNLVLFFVNYKWGRIDGDYYREIKNEYSNIDTMVLYDELYEQYLIEPSKELERKMNTLSVVQQEEFYILEYDNYIASVKNNYTISNEISIFSNEDEFSLRNINKTYNDYMNIENVNPVFDGTYGIAEALECDYTNVLFFCFIVILIYFVSIEEKSSGMLELVTATENGRASRMLCQWFAVMIVTFSMYIILYFTNIICAWGLMGGIDFSLPIQSLYGYDKSVFSITIGEYLVLFVIWKYASVVCIATIILLIGSLLRRSIPYYFTVIILFITNLLMDNVDRLWGLKEYAKYSNLKYIFESVGFFKNYHNYSVFDCPVSHGIVNIVFIVVLTLAAVGGLVIVSACRLELWSIKVPFYKKRKSFCSSNLFFHEVKKNMIGNKLILVVLLVLVISIMWFSKKEPYYSLEDLYYLEYLNASRGLSESELLEFNEDEELRLEEIHTAIDELYSRYMAGEMDEETYLLRKDVYDTMLLCERGFLKWQNQYYYVVEYNDFHHDKISLVNSLGWERVFGFTDESENDFELFDRLIYIFIVPVVAMIFFVETSSGTIALNKSTYNGRGKLITNKLVLGVLTAVLCASIFYIPYVFFVIHNYGLDSLSGIVTSMEFLSDVTPILSLVGYFILAYIAKLIKFGVFAFAVMLLAKFVQNYIVTIVIGLIVGMII